MTTPVRAAVNNVVAKFTRDGWTTRRACRTSAAVAITADFACEKRSLARTLCRQNPLKMTESTNSIDLKLETQTEPQQIVAGDSGSHTRTALADGKVLEVKGDVTDVAVASETVSSKTKATLYRCSDNFV